MLVSFPLVFTVNLTEQNFMSQHRSLRAASTLGGKRNVLKRFERTALLEKRGQRKPAREHWMLYLRYAPNGPWAEQARAHLKQPSARQKPSQPIPFPRKA